MSYYGFTVTDKGRALIAKLVAGKQLELSKIMVGSGSYTLSLHDALPI